MDKTIADRLRTITSIAYMICTDETRDNPDYALGLEERIIEQVNAIKQMVGIE